MNDFLNNLWDFMVEESIATKDELVLVTKINGTTLETFQDVLYVRTGYRSFDGYRSNTDLLAWESENE